MFFPVVTGGTAAASAEYAGEIGAVPEPGPEGDFTDIIVCGAEQDSGFADAQVIEILHSCHAGDFPEKMRKTGNAEHAGICQGLNGDVFLIMQINMSHGRHQCHGSNRAGGTLIRNFPGQTAQKCPKEAFLVGIQLLTGADTFFCQQQKKTNTM